MKALSIVLLVLTVFTITACNSEKKKLQQKIDAAEAKKTNKPNAEMDMAKAELYVEYANRFAQDTLSPVYLYKAATIYQHTSHFNRSIELFDKVEKNYPTHPLAAEALFYKGVMYENELQDFPRAKEAFEALIQRFPEHPYAAVAKTNLPYVGTMPDFVKKLEAGTYVDSTSDGN